MPQVYITRLMISTIWQAYDAHYLRSYDKIETNSRYTSETFSAFPRSQLHTVEKGSLQRWPEKDLQHNISSKLAQSFIPNKGFSIRFSAQIASSGRSPYTYTLNTVLKQEDLGFISSTAVITFNTFSGGCTIGSESCKIGTNNSYSIDALYKLFPDRISASLRTQNGNHITDKPVNRTPNLEKKTHMDFYLSYVNITAQYSSS